MAWHVTPILKVEWLIFLSLVRIRGKDAFVILLLLQGKHQLFLDWIDFIDEQHGMHGIQDSLFIIQVE